MEERVEGRPLLAVLVTLCVTVTAAYGVQRDRQGSRARLPADGPAAPPSASALTRSSRRTGATQCVAKCRFGDRLQRGFPMTPVSYLRLRALLVKEFIQMRRDRVTFAMMLGMAAVWESLASLIGIVDGAVDAITEPELAREMDRETA